MHVLYELSQKFSFELKGGTSLSKGYKIIDRFSEDIDIYIHPPIEMNVEENPKKQSKAAINSRKNFFDTLAKGIQIDGITEVSRDTEFDDPSGYYRSGGIRLLYRQQGHSIQGLKQGILLEVGFDNVQPYELLDISSWAFEEASKTPNLDLIDNRATNIACYHPGYTFVEKLQTVATKYRKEIEDGKPNQNLMRQYYDLYCLLSLDIVKKFIGTDEYLIHKKARFPKADFQIPVIDNEAFLLSDKDLRAKYRQRYQATSALYYKGQPDFDLILARISEFLPKL